MSKGLFIQNANIIRQCQHQLFNKPSSSHASNVQLMVPNIRHTCFGASDGFWAISPPAFPHCHIPLTLFITLTLLSVGTCELFGWELAGVKFALGREGKQLFGHRIFLQPFTVVQFIVIEHKYDNIYKRKPCDTLRYNFLRQNWYSYSYWYDCVRQWNTDISSEWYSCIYQVVGNLLQLFVEWMTTTTTYPPPKKKCFIVLRSM